MFEYKKKLSSLSSITGKKKKRSSLRVALESWVKVKIRQNPQAHLLSLVLASVSL